MSNESEQLSLVLPDQALSPNEFKDYVRAIARAALPHVMVRTYTRIMSGESTVEECRKFAADLTRITGVEEEKKLDPYAGLPVINFVFGRRGEISAEVVEVLASVPASADQSEPAIDPMAEYEGLALIDDLGEAAVRRRKTLTLPKEPLHVIPDETSPLPTQDPSVSPAGPERPRPHERPLPEGQPASPAPGISPEPLERLPDPATLPRKAQVDDMQQHLDDLDDLLGLG